MSLRSQQIPSMFNGVSQQPATLRLLNQAEEQVNGYGTVATGLDKRPPLEFVASIQAQSDVPMAIHTINRDATERYIVVVGSNVGIPFIKVYDLDGNEKVVETPVANVLGYLDTDNPARDIALVTVADFTFIVNRSKVVALETADSEPAGWEYYEWLGKSFNIENYKGNYTGALNGQKQTFQDLPKEPTENTRYRIVGYDEDSFTTYYVQRKGGVWVETVAPDRGQRPDPTTMPHALVRTPDGNFSLVPFLWNARLVGDEFSNPPPTFVGSTINDVFFYKNRLGFVSDENVIFSGAGDFGNFWRTTVTDLLDSDVVDVAVSHTKVSILRYAVPFNSGMMVFADQTQFSLSSEDLLTPSSVSIDAATEYEMSSDVRPIGIGSDVYFITPSGDYSRVREYYVDSETNANQAADITAHVPRYIPQGVTKITANANEDVLFCIAPDKEPAAVYVYKFFWNEQGKAQSSWSKWTLPGVTKIINVEVLENELYLLLERTNGLTYLERCNVQEGEVSDGLNYKVLLDGLAPVTGVYYPTPDETVFTLPYSVAIADRDKYQLVYGSGSSGVTGALSDPTQYEWTNLNEITVPGDRSGPAFGGYSYTFRYEFSEQFLRKEENIAVTTGRLQLRTFTLYFTDTAYFQVEVAPYGVSPTTEPVVPAKLDDFTGKTVGSDDLTLNTPIKATGRYTFQIYGESKVATVAITNDMPVPSRLQSAEWEALYHNRASI